MGFSDGGLRRNSSGDKAATGWAIFALEGKEAWLLGEGGTLILAHSHGSFGAEAYALEELTASLTYLYDHSGTTDNSWKNCPVQYITERIARTRRI